MFCPRSVSYADPMTKPLVAALLAASFLSAAPVAAQKVRPASVRAHVTFLASDALQGRASATRDEAIAAAYVAARFAEFGLEPAPGMTGYLQTVRIVRPRIEGAAALTVGGVPSGAPLLLYASEAPVRGKLTVFGGSEQSALPSADVVLATSTDLSPAQITRAMREKKIKLLILTETAASRELLGRIGGKPRLPARFEGALPSSTPTVVTLPAAAIEALAAKAGREVELTLPGLVEERATTTNAVGWLPGRDPAAGVLLLSAHLDHLGKRPDGSLMLGANDDASGTTAVLELARALAGRGKTRRGILFVAYGSEEIGGFGAKHFADHPPVPLTTIVANIEFEMIGAQDPKLPKGSLMMTGFERSTMGSVLTRHGALVSPDPYPEENFFQRSDNYALALKGLVAHTLSGWATVPTYHQPSDTLDALDVDFMTRAIRSLVKPIRSLANSSARPRWNPGGQPKE